MKRIPVLIRKYLSAENIEKLKTFSQHIPLQSIPLWIASAITALTAVAYSMIFTYAENFRIYLSAQHPYLFFIITPASFFLSWYFVYQFSPFASGSGIPQLMAAVELSDQKKSPAIFSLLNAKIFLVKIISSITAILGGAVIGREGPTLQLSGSIFYYTHRWLPERWPKFSRKVMLITGGAAGLSAAFNTPLGGIVFVIEELTRTHITTFRTAVFSAVIIAGMTAQLILGPYLYIGYPTIVVEGYQTILWSGLIGIIIAPIGIFYTSIVYNIMRWRKTVKSFKKQILYSLSFGFAVALFMFFVGSESCGSGRELFTHLLFTPGAEVNVQTALSRIVTSIFSYSNGSAGGVFSPALGTGAGLASLLAQLFHVSTAYHNMLILAGMCSFLTVVTGSPFTSAIIVLEMTDRHSAIFHLMLAAMLSHLTARLMQKESFYERIKHDFLKLYSADEQKAIIPEKPAKTSASA
ncbi:MAG: chloride channel protein [Bacteroidetes bacterium]|nr:chloride channel protein [Bacteroidota bacterium]